VYGASCWFVAGAEEGFEVHGAGSTHRSIQWIVTKRLFLSFVNMLTCFCTFFIVRCLVAGAEEGSEVHGAGCQRVCSCSGRDHRQGAHPCHPTAQGALPLPVGNVQGPFRGMPFPLHPLRACSQVLCEVSWACTARLTNLLSSYLSYFLGLIWQSAL